jgi:hypothetical protein
MEIQRSIIIINSVLYYFLSSCSLYFSLYVERLGKSIHNRIFKTLSRRAAFYSSTPGKAHYAHVYHYFSAYIPLIIHNHSEHKFEIMCYRIIIHILNVNIVTNGVKLPMHHAILSSWLIYLNCIFCTAFNEKLHDLERMWK